MTTTDEAADTDIVVPLHPRRRERVALFQKIQDIIPAAGLVTAAWQAATTGASGLDLALASVEIVTGAMLIGTLVRDMLKPAPETLEEEAEEARLGSAVDWAKIWSAGVLFAEAAERWHSQHRVARPMILTAVVTLGLGIFDSRLAARRERLQSLRVTRDHLQIGGRRFKPFIARWDEIAAIDIANDRAVIRTHRGRPRRLRLNRLEHLPAVLEALDQAQRQLAAHRAATSRHDRS